MQTLLITGGLGFIGVNLIEALVGSGDYRIRVLDDESMGKRDHLGSLIDHVELTIGDYRDVEALDEVLPGTDAVVHLAADTRVIDSVENPQHNFDVNVAGTFTLLERMRRLGVRRLVTASTGGAVLGEAPTPIHEDIVPHPLSPYGAGKLAVEGYCSAYAGAYGFDVTTLRFSNIYGPHSYHKGSVVAAFYKAILRGEGLVIYGDGSQTRDFIHVSDIVQGIRLGLERSGSDTFLLGSGAPTSVNELLDLMRDVIGADRAFDVRYEPFRDGEVLHSYGRIDKARKVLGFEPRIQLAEGLASTWKWLEEHYRAGEDQR